MSKYHKMPSININVNLVLVITEKFILNILYYKFIGKWRLFSMIETYFSALSVTVNPKIQKCPSVPWLSQLAHFFYKTCKWRLIGSAAINTLKLFRFAPKLFMYSIQNYCMYKIYEKVKSISEQFRSIYEKCHNSSHYPTNQ